MNERIQLLAVQAGMALKPRRPYDDKEPDGYLESDLDYLENNLEATRMFFEGGLEKFAELIVRECNYLIQQQVSLKYKDGWEQSGISDDWAGGHYAASILSRTVIKQHFGVAE